MLNVPRCYRSYTWCAENKRFRLSNFPSLSQLSLSSDMALRARTYTCAALYANNECTGWRQLTPCETETPTAERQIGRSVGRLVGRLVGRSVGCSRATPLKLKGRRVRDGLFSRRLKLKLGCIAFEYNTPGQTAPSVSLPSSSVVN